MENSIELGAEMVELDIQKSKDGVFVVFHDSWLDRSSTCKGELAKRTLAELKECRLVIAGTGVPTDERIPTLAEMLAVTRDRIFVNIDNKLDIDALPDIVAVAREAGAGRPDRHQAQSVERRKDRRDDARCWRRPAAARSSCRSSPTMPCAIRNSSRPPRSTFAADAVELIAWHKGGEPMTEDGGPLFGAKARAVAARGDWHLWSTPTPSSTSRPACSQAGAATSSRRSPRMPGEAYGFWVDRGATIIQTDEPKAAIEWLEANGFACPIARTRSRQAGTASIN